MDSKIIALIVVILLVIVGLGAYFLGSQSSNTPNETVNNTTNTTSHSGTYRHHESQHPKHINVTNNTKTNVTAQQAMEIVDQMLHDPSEGFIDYNADTPYLMKAPNNRLVWHVPVMDPNNEYAWSVDVDAQTGEIYTLY